MDIRKVKKLIELLETSAVHEIEITEGEESVRISRAPEPAPAPAQHQVAAAQPVLVEAQAVSTTPEPNMPGAHTIAAPMVGTFFSAPTPGAKPFASVGMEVAIGQTLGIIEAMKMMNHIESDRAGRLAEILVANGEPVEFGQPMFVIE